MTKTAKLIKQGAVWDKDGLAPTLDTMQGGWRQPSVIIDDTMGFEKEARVYTDYSPSLRASRSGLKTVESDNTEGITIKNAIKSEVSMEHKS